MLVGEVLIQKDNNYKERGRRQKSRKKSVPMIGPLNTLEANRGTTQKRGFWIEEEGQYVDRGNVHRKEKGTSK